MAASGSQTIQLYYSTSSGTAPVAGNLANGELAINITDGKLYYKDNSGVVQTMATKGTALIGGSNTQVQYNNGGALAGSGNLTFDGTTLTAGGLSGPLNGSVGATTPNTGAFTNLSSSGTVSGIGFSNYLASPPAIGGTTPAAGSFTTLSASGSVTLSGGTANGVLYLNGSKVATSGSALTFNGTVLYTNGKIGVGEINPTALVEARNTSIARMDADSSAVYFGSGNNYPVSFKVNDSEQMRLTSTGLGIGTSSPSTKLDVYDASSPRVAVSGPSTATGYLIFRNTTSGVNRGYVGYEFANDAIPFATAGSERMRLDSSGNLGIGTSSPSTWNTKLVVYNNQLTVTGGGYDGTFADSIYFGGNAEGTTYRNKISNSLSSIASSQMMKFSIANGASTWVDVLILNGAGNAGLGVTPKASSWPSFENIGGVITAYNAETVPATYFTANAYYNSGWKYKSSASNRAWLFSMDAYNGNISWQVASAGTAGNAISFTQAMTLGADGLLQVGTTTGAVPDGKLQVSATGTGSGAANTVVGFNCFEETSGNKAGIWLGAMTNSNVAVIGSRTASGAIAFQTFNSGWGERMRITSGGDVGIGTSSPSAKLHVAGTVIIDNADANNELTFSGTQFTNVLSASTSGFQLGTTGAGYLAFLTSNSERARIDSSGNLLVGKTSTGLATGVQLEAAGGSSFVRSASTNSDLNLYVYSTGAGAARFYVGMGGTVYATSTTITAISDQRLKENIQDLDVGLDKIMSLKPRKFDWKAGKGKDKKGDRGWIAQEFEQVFPDMVDTWADPAPEGEEPYKAVNADLIPVLVKAIQEQQAIIEQLKADVAALKGA